MSELFAYICKFNKHLIKILCAAATSQLQIFFWESHASHHYKFYSIRWIIPRKKTLLLQLQHKIQLSNLLAIESLTHPHLDLSKLTICTKITNHSLKCSYFSYCYHFTTLNRWMSVQKTWTNHSSSRFKNFTIIVNVY